jgi:hypothetical protein
VNGSKSSTEEGKIERKIRRRIIITMRTTTNVMTRKKGRDDGMYEGE